MATSVTISGSTYSYTISNIQNALTCTPSNRNSRYGAVYAKPTIKRNKSGEAFRRYFYFRFIIPGEGEFYHDVEYRAIFTKSGTTATVDEVNAGQADHMLGDYANYISYAKSSGSYSGTLKILASTGEVEDAWTYVTTTYTASAGSGWTPTMSDISYTLSQSEAGDPSPSVFGYVLGFAKASWLVQSATTGRWQYTSPFGTAYISPHGSLSLSANGESTKQSSTYSFSNVSLQSKLLTSETTTATATISTYLRGSLNKTAIVTAQPYNKPTINTLSISRTSATRSQDSAVISVGWIIDALNKQSTVTPDITAGAVTASWVSVDLQDPDTEYASGSFDIISDGDSVTTLADQADEIATDANRTRAHDTYDSNHTYRFTVTLTDRLGQSSEPIPAILNSKFFLISAKAGGKGIGFGMAPLEQGFHVNMPATFYDDVSSLGDISSSGDVTDGSGNVLANKQDKFADDSWHTISLASGYTAKGGGCRYRKKNGFVELYINFAASAAHTSFANITTSASILPVGYRPVSTVACPVQANTTVIQVVHVNTDGTISCYCSGQTGAWFTGYVMFAPA